MQAVAKAETRFRQLCCLGLGSQALMPALLCAMHELVPSSANNFLWVDASGEPSNCYVESPDMVAILPRYFAERHAGESAVCGLSVPEKMRRLSGVHLEPDPVTVAAARNTDFYHNICRPMDWDHSLSAVVRDADGVGLGIMQLVRGEGEAPYRSAEMRRMARLAPYVAHAFGGLASATCHWPKVAKAGC